MAQIQFNAAVVDPFGDRTPVPAGNYRVVLKQSGIEVPKSGQGKMVQLQMSVVEGEQQGKVIFQNINYLSPNPTAQQIGQSKLSSLCHVCGVLQLQDTQQLHGIPFRVQVSVSEDGRYNEVDAFQREDGQPIVKGVAGPTAGAPTQAPSWAAPAPQQAAPAPQPAPQQAQAPAPQPWQQPAAPVQQQAPAPQQMPAPQSPPWQQPQQGQPPAQQPPQQGQAPATPPWQRPS
jgi:hypothetical protein